MHAPQESYESFEKGARAWDSLIIAAFFFHPARALLMGVPIGLCVYWMHKRWLRALLAQPERVDALAAALDVPGREAVTGSRGR